MDEPTKGIDVASARHVRQLIAHLHEVGTTIFLTTHYIEEAEGVCHRIAFLVSGRIVRMDSVANLLQPVKDHFVLNVHGVQDISGALLEDGRGMFSRVTFSLENGKLLRLEAADPFVSGLWCVR
ncbi:MAG: hypothetical protein WHS46_03660 [Desulfosoma sp.]